MGRFSRVTEHRFVCRIGGGHKWERFQPRHKYSQFQTSYEEAYRCVRCGRRHYGKLNQAGSVPFAGGDAGGGFGGGDFGGGGGGDGG